ncbi:hypothetical protein CBR_g1150 [Chara braunii]|uniref:Reverse transcriptase domain-containing protein n=1 Tax=Chara braunii TaxID=69332 RepID=A0A388KD99_CHABU|nr:hypothetical protein CBR_g1150 [Chara braunii]|eukprot:GBG68030.1 hypothetical protein CBR_g1150 [Chara braunii]
MRICNAHATFQGAMNVTFQKFVNKTRLTQGMINFCVIMYKNDILVYSETYHGHAQHIEWMLGALRDAGFKIVLEKSEFFLSEISFLGYVVTRGGLRPDLRKVAAVKDTPVPTSLTQVRAFLGLASYFCRFIKGFAAIARPLTNLLWKDLPLSWDAECEQAFTTLKDALATTPILIRSEPTKQFILITDWQLEAIFAILAQKGNVGREHVIEYASRIVPDERRNDSAPQGECYVVVRGIQHFHPYLYRRKVLVVTDHEPLLALKRLINYTGMIGRWAAFFLEIDVTNLTVWDPIIRRGNARQGEKEDDKDDEEEESSEDRDDPDYVQGEEEEDEEGEPAEEEGVAGEPSQWPGRSKEEEEAEAQKRLEKAEGKRPVTEGTPPDWLLGDPWLDPEPPKEEEGGHGASAEGSGRRRRRRSESPTSSGSPARPAIRLRQNEGDRASSPVVLSPSP